ncbi:MAG: glycogen/starch synthase [Flavobacteriales bacterium]|nr:glycogen/starch synthase [Flavobacteriales bacterium]
MQKRRILYVSSEAIPYLPENQISAMSLEMPKKMNELKNEVRIFMPRYGAINERRHQLHEVIRLSGMNLVVNDMDQPLIIKVASIPKERLQVYFIDNEEYFKRKAVVADNKGKFFEDNDERAIFYAKGVLETVKKLNWTPDIIHVSGWMASLLPMYVKTIYNDDPTFAETKVVTSVYNFGFTAELNGKMIDKVKFDGIADEKLDLIETPTLDNLTKLAVSYSDGVILGSDILAEDVLNHVNEAGIPVLPFHDIDVFAEAYNNFYHTEVLGED